jgi:hypothetical protein
MVSAWLPDAFVIMSLYAIKQLINDGITIQKLIPLYFSYIHWGVALNIIIEINNLMRL